jgi:hypothetical protein
LGNCFVKVFHSPDYTSNHHLPPRKKGEKNYVF